MNPLVAGHDDPRRDSQQEARPRAIRQTLPGEGLVECEPYLGIEAYDGGTFLEAQQPTKDNHGAMGEDSHG